MRSMPKCEINPIQSCVKQKWLSNEELHANPKRTLLAVIMDKTL